MDNRDANETKAFDDVDEIVTAEELIEFIKNSENKIDLSEKEADLLVGYMEGHDYILGVCNGELLRGDKADNNERIVWEEYNFEDVIDIVCEWNYELILAQEDIRDNPDNFIEFANAENYYKELKKEEVILDKLFAHTHYSKEIEATAEKLANEVVEIMSENKDRITEAASEVVKEIHHYSEGRRGR